MKKLLIDLSDFVEAMTFYGDIPDAGAYPNIKTGEIIHFMDPGIKVIPPNISSAVGPLDL